jgi:hypothetical protein
VKVLLTDQRESGCCWRLVSLVKDVVRNVPIERCRCSKAWTCIKLMPQLKIDFNFHFVYLIHGKFKVLFLKVFNECKCQFKPEHNLGEQTGISETSIDQFPFGLHINSMLTVWKKINEMFYTHLSNTNNKHTSLYFSPKLYLSISHYLLIESMWSIKIKFHNIL